MKISYSIFLCYLFLPLSFYNYIDFRDTWIWHWFKYNQQIINYISRIRINSDQKIDMNDGNWLEKLNYKNSVLTIFVKKLKLLILMTSIRNLYIIDSFNKKNKGLN